LIPPTREASEAWNYGVINIIVMVDLTFAATNWAFHADKVLIKANY